MRIIVSPFGTHYLDQNTFIAWSNILNEFGFNSFYNSWSDYLPGYLYLLFLLSKINLLNIIPTVILYKLPAIFCDLILGYLIYKVSKKFNKEKIALIITSLYIFNPAIWGNSSMWGQVDSLTSLFSLGAIASLPNFWLSAALLALSVLIKPQAAFIAPVIFLYFIKEKWRIEKIIYYIVFSGTVFLSGFIPFYSGNENIVVFVINRISIVLNQYKYGSVNAFNFWALWGFWKPDNLGIINYQIVGFALVNILSVIAYFLVRKKKGFIYLLSSFIYLITYLFMTRMHERHMLPALAPLVISLNFLPNLIFVYLTFSLIYIANLLYSYRWMVDNFLEIFSKPIIWVMIIVEIILLGYMFYETKIKTKQIKLDKLLNFFKSLIKNIKQAKEIGQKDSFPLIKINQKTRKLILLVILLFSLGTRLYGLNYPQKEYFDEVYHAFTAKEMLHGNVASWEWWNTPPEGFAYEWTHPPLAKLFMWGSMALFGESSFSWRLPGAILGTGVVFLIYLIAKKIFKDEILALISAGFFSLDGLALTMSRIGMNDTYLLFFSLLAIYFFLRNKDFLSSVSFGLAISSKWSALWVVPILFVIWLSRKKKFDLKILWFLIIPPLVYLASYIPMFLTGHSLDIFWGMQKQMWWYHTRLEATHPYTSLWWTWPLNVRPVYLFTTDEVGGFVSRIYNLGNPIVFWFGLVSVISSFVYSLINKNKNLALVVFSYLVFFVPWAASPRIMFFYHYLPTLPFLSIATGYVLRKEKRLIIPVFSIALLVFIYFYPHWTGIQIPTWLDESYYWFTSWI